MRPVMRACLLLLLAAGYAPAQALSFGLQAGIPLTNLLAAASPAYHTATSRYTFGPAVRIGLPHRCGFEAGVLYKRLEYGAGALSGSAGRWEVPLLIEYSLRQPVVRPFFGVGVSFNRVTGATTTGLIELCACGVIVAEVFQGLRRDKGRDELQRLFRDLSFLEPSGIELYLRSAEIYRAREGPRYDPPSTA